MQYNSFVINAAFAKLIIFTFSLNRVREVLSQMCGSVRFCSGVVNVSYIINQQPTFLDLTFNGQYHVVTVRMLKSDLFTYRIWYILYLAGKTSQQSFSYH